MRYRCEDRLQQAIFQHIRWRGVCGLVAFAVPNGGKRTPIEAQILKATGVRAGVSDMIFLHAGRAYAIELKTTKGRASNAQIQFMDDWRAAGGEGIIAQGLDEAINQLEKWGLLHRNVAHERPSLAYYSS